MKPSNVIFVVGAPKLAVHKIEKAAEMPDARSSVDKALTWARLWNNRTDEAIEQWVDAFYGTKDEWVSDLKRVLREQGRVAPAIGRARDSDGCQ